MLKTNVFLIYISHKNSSKSGVEESDSFTEKLRYARKLKSIWFFAKKLAVQAWFLAKLFENQPLTLRSTKQVQKNPCRTLKWFPLVQAWLQECTFIDRKPGFLLQTTSTCKISLLQSNSHTIQLQLVAWETLMSFSFMTCHLKKAWISFCSKQI